MSEREIFKARTLGLIAEGYADVIYDTFIAPMEERERQKVKRFGAEIFKGLFKAAVKEQSRGQDGLTPYQVIQNAKKYGVYLPTEVQND